MLSGTLNESDSLDMSINGSSPKHVRSVRLPANFIFSPVSNDLRPKTSKRNILGVLEREGEQV